MTKWFQRALVFAAAMVVLRLLQGALINAWESQSALISVVLLLMFVIGVLVWGAFDGKSDASANPDPDRRQDLATTWLVAGLVTGVISGAVAWLISLLYKAIYVGGLLNELTTFAAFTTLLVFIPAMAGVVIGRFLVDRGYAKMPVHHHGLAAHDEAGGDVFAAVGAGGQSAAAAGEAPTAGFTTEEFPTDAGATTSFGEEPTADIPTEDTDPGYRSS